jgi:superfamily II DNA or RNA helicase
MILRPYQSRDVENIRSLFQKGLKRICYAAPTGSGKTVLFCFAARRAIENGRRVIILVHRQELIEQTCAALSAEGV